MKAKRVSTSQWASLVEQLLVYSVSDAGSAAPDVIPAAIDAIASHYGERPFDTAKRIARKAEMEIRTAPSPATYTTRAAVFAAAQDANG